MKIAILYIATGKYSLFWSDFHVSCERFFLKNEEKHYFVFSDSPDIIGHNVHLIYQKCRGFPLDSLFRFEMFLTIKKTLLEYDYIVFFNANMLFCHDVDREFLPAENNNWLLGVLHPIEIKRYPSFFFSYERNRLSKAYIPPHRPPYHYYMGGCNGGRAKEYLAMVEELATEIQEDYEKGMIAVFHDESHINRYFHVHRPLTLGNEYGTPEGWRVAFPPKIIIRDKVKIDSFFRKNSPGLRALVRRKIRKLYDAIRWYW